ncbi:type II toxin-antitoxin system HicB family antitoxin [Bradyrhizobium sp. 87]|uniref:type II toxin-antitoxin system HicB family antitoxin n=1 Tax=Bradyrhizobium sp. 87 TaxID=2782682 RepID=UPI001FFC07EA|nr:type II toxin-antitoxin system HicB family antitoxin [Bradyrhizobium sp. 87]MCK1430880.1 type II toxin-antitoxin system HicB family antitoxin [Bradyrhizobium sp. 87]
MRTTDYAVTIQALPAADGGGFMAYVLDLPGCTSDGETPQEALANAQDAIVSWIEAAHEMGRPIPEPTREEPAQLLKVG